MIFTIVVAPVLYVLTCWNRTVTLICSIGAIVCFLFGRDVAGLVFLVTCAIFVAFDLGRTVTELGMPMGKRR